MSGEPGPGAERSLDLSLLHTTPSEGDLGLFITGGEQLMV